MKKQVEIVRGLTMPFLPMRAAVGRTLRTPKLVNALWKEMKEDTGWWLVQPKLNGDRVCLAVVDDRVYVQDELGQWYRRQVCNKESFLKLPNRTCLDGHVWQGYFYVSDALAVAGKSFLPATAAEREVTAFQLVRLLNQPWMFERPDRRWLMRRWRNLPQYAGIIKKRAESVYTLGDAGAGDQTVKPWLQRHWDNRKIL